MTDVMIISDSVGLDEHGSIVASEVSGGAPSWSYNSRVGFDPASKKTRGLFMGSDGTGMRLMGPTNTFEHGKVQVEGSQFLYLLGPNADPMTGGSGADLVFEKGHGIMVCDYVDRYFGLIAEVPTTSNGLDPVEDPREVRTAGIVTDGRGDLLMSRRVGNEEDDADGFPGQTTLLGMHVHWPFDLWSPEGSALWFGNDAPQDAKLSTGVFCKTAGFQVWQNAWSETSSFTMAYQDILMRRGQRLWLGASFPGPNVLSREVAMWVTQMKDEINEEPLQYAGEQLRIGWVGVQGAKYPDDCSIPQCSNPADCPELTLAVPRPDIEFPSSDQTDDRPLVIKARRVDTVGPLPGETKYYFRTYLRDLYLLVNDEALLTEDQCEDAMSDGERGMIAIIRESSANGSPLKYKLEVTVDTNQKFAAILEPVVP